MADPIGKGDWVERINAGGGRVDIVPLHSIHLVEDAADYRGIPCLILKGVVSPDGFRWVRADHFRPIYRPDESLISRLLEPLPDCVEQVSA